MVFDYLDEYTQGKGIGLDVHVGDEEERGVS